MEQDIQFMRLALELAQESAQEMEVPVGAVVVCRGAVIGTGRNRRERRQDALAHAELEAVAAACRALGSWRLEGCTLYVTLEPCPMCAGAMINSRMERVVFGAFDPKAGACGSLVNLFAYPFNHKCELLGGVLEAECAGILREFFRNLRMK
ncbi:MAG: tRNA adenosine(34) deaminase TadA [Clostridiales bacterium]|nr:tRNA adenosine(34) deaminase TadA [Clostridiales bacterium]